MKIDVNDLNYYFYDEESNLLYNAEKYKINVFSVLRDLLEVLTKAIASIPYFLDANYYNFCLKKDFALFAFTNNNRRSLSPLQKYLPSSHLFSEKEIRFKKVWFYALLYSPIVLYRCVTYTGYKQETYCYNFKGFCKSYGMFVEATKMLKLINPKTVIVANNQTYTSRSFYKAAKKLGIKTVFLQHATAVESDPPLDFDYAFLDGLEAYEKFATRNACLCTVFLSGNPRFDFIPEVGKNISKDLRILGLAINLLDEERYVKEFIVKCKREIPGLQIVLRPHPTTNTLYWLAKSKEWNCDFSNSAIENPFDFIERCTFFVAGDSSFHLDVSISNKRSFYYNFTSEQSMDLYSYIKNDLIMDISTDFLEYLKNAIREESEYQNKKTDYYVANFKTVYWRKSARLIATTLINIVDNNSLKERWRKCDKFYKIKE